MLHWSLVVRVGFRREGQVYPYEGLQGLTSTDLKEYCELRGYVFCEILLVHGRQSIALSESSLQITHYPQS